MLSNAQCCREKVVNIVVCSLWPAFSSCTGGFASLSRIVHQISPLCLGQSRTLAVIYVPGSFRLPGESNLFAPLCPGARLAQRECALVPCFLLGPLEPQASQTSRICMRPTGSARNKERRAQSELAALFEPFVQIDVKPGQFLPATNFAASSRRTPRRRPPELASFSSPLLSFLAAHRPREEKSTSFSAFRPPASRTSPAPNCQFAHLASRETVSAAPLDLLTSWPAVWAAVWATHAGPNCASA